MVVILRHFGGLSTEKVTEIVIAGNNGKITEWIKGEVVARGIQSSGARTSSNVMDQIDVQEINSITISDYNTILVQLVELETKYDIPSCIVTTVTDKFEGNLQNPEEWQQLARQLFEAVEDVIKEGKIISKITSNDPIYP